MKVIINKKEETLKDNMTVAALLIEKDMKTRSAVWVNGKQLLLKEYDSHVIKEGDQIKILRIVAGG